MAGAVLGLWKHSVDLALVLGRNRAPVLCSSPAAEKHKLPWVLTIWFEMVQWCFIPCSIKARFLGQAVTALRELTCLPNFCIR